MKTTKISSLVAMALSSTGFYASAETKATVGLDFNLRYESVSQDNLAKDADALTLRTKLNFQTSSYNGLSGFVEFEDSRVIAGVDDYKDTLGKNDDHSVIADPETSELDQAFIQFTKAKLTAKLGRQVIALDGHRFVGHVGWRQDKQTFDGVTLTYQASDKLTLNYGYISQRNRIFAQEKDFDSKDHLFNASYTSSFGKLTAYGYLLELDQGTENGLDSFGISFAGKKDKFSYAAEFASQKSESTAADFDATYIALAGGYSFSGVTAKVGVEILGSDDGQFGFSTPLATLHKFNGWSDQFLGTPKEGLTDIYVSVAGKAMGGRWLLAIHNFSAVEGSALVDDLGSEINAVYSKSFTKNYSGGIKLASYSAGDAGTDKVDTDKVWLWLSTKF